MKYSMAGSTFRIIKFPRNVLRFDAYNFNYLTKHPSLFWLAKMHLLFQFADAYVNVEFSFIVLSSVLIFLFTMKSKHFIVKYENNI